MWMFALLVFLFVAIALSLGAFAIAAPILAAAGILLAVNLLGLAAGFRFAPWAWSFYTALCGVRAALMMGSATMLQDNLNGILSGLLQEYLLISALALLYWAVREYRARSKRGARTRAQMQAQAA